LSNFCCIDFFDTPKTLSANILTSLLDKCLEMFARILTILGGLWIISKAFVKNLCSSKRVSFVNFIAELVLVLDVWKFWFSDAKRLREAAEATALRPDSFSPPSWLLANVILSVKRSERGWPVYSITPKFSVSRSNQTTQRLVYLHGGGYFREIVPIMWRFVAKIAELSSCEVIVPIYPLFPLATAEHVVDHAAEIVRQLIADHGSDNVVVMGDSAGGGMSLAVALHLKARGGLAAAQQLQPRRLILISPFLDATVSDPRQVDLEAVDPMISIVGARECGRLYAGSSLPVTDYRVSPLLVVDNELRGVCPMTVFVGGREVVWTDALRLAEKASAVGVEVELHEQPGLIHDWVLFPTSEGRQARNRICEICRHVDSASKKPSVSLISRKSI
jgi:acetyl esterase/lipase